MATKKDENTSNGGRLAYTIVYVKDVAKSLEFYSKAFGMETRRLDHARMWGELESGETTIAFTPKVQHESDISSGGPRHAAPYQNVEMCLSFPDVDHAFERAVKNGAETVASLEDKHWGQRVAYLKDPDGVIIRISSPAP